MSAGHGGAMWHNKHYLLWGLIMAGIVAGVMMLAVFLHAVRLAWPSIITTGSGSNHLATFFGTFGDWNYMLVLLVALLVGGMALLKAYVGLHHSRLLGLLHEMLRGAFLAAGICTVWWACTQDLYMAKILYDIPSFVVHLRHYAGQVMTLSLQDDRVLPFWISVFFGLLGGLAIWGVKQLRN